MKNDCGFDYKMNQEIWHVNLFYKLYIRDSLYYEEDDQNNMTRTTPGYIASDCEGF